jgi:Tol biopolymer transport system component
MRQCTIRFLRPLAVVGRLLAVGVPMAALAPTTTLVSINSAGTGSGNGDSFNPVLSAEGRIVAFGSSASDLVPNDTNGAADIFVRDLKRGTTTLVSVNGAGTGSGNSDSFSSRLSADGQVVAIESSASDLVANDTNEEVQDIFVRPIP